MSRRRRRAKPSSLAPSECVTVSWVCTGRNLHPEVAFGQVDVFPELRGEATGSVNIELKTDAHFVEGKLDFDAAAPFAAIARGHNTYTLRCSRCRPARNVPLRTATIEELSHGLAAAGATRLDISALGELPARISEQ